MIKNNVLVAMPWNEKSADQLDVTSMGLSSLINYDVVIADDSINKTYAKEFRERGYTTIDLKPKGKTIEERLVHARNTLREYFLVHEEYTHIFWYEGDIICPPNTIHELIIEQKHNITAVRPQHGGIPGVFPYREDLPKDLYKTNQLPNFTITHWEWLCPSRLAEVSCYGTGCNLINREATEKAEFWCKPYSPATHDILYSMDLQLLGYPTYCLTGLLCAHHYKPMKHPDERFDHNGDWSDLDKYRRHTIQWKK